MTHSTRATIGLLAGLVGASVLAGCSSPTPRIDGVTSKSGAPMPSPTTQNGQLSPTGADLAAYTSQQVDWSRDHCPASMSKVINYSSRTECATIKAPKDYSDPGKGDLTLMVTRTRSENAGARPLFTNPGGPGGPAGTFSAVVALLTPQGKSHDVYGVDPRGTGDSTPIACKSYAANSDDARDTSQSVVRAEQAAAKKTVEECWATHGDMLPYITTDNTARDQDLVRQLIKADTIDYYGVSAGTWLGARYATIFPKHTGRFVLDSNTEFTAGFDQTFNAQPEGFQARFDQQFLPWLARHDDRYGFGSDETTVKANYEKIRTAAKDHKLGQFTPDAIDGISAQLMYADRSFSSLASLYSLLLEAADGDERALKSAESAAGGAGSGGGSNAENTVFMATLCNDTPWPKDPDKVSSLEQTTGAKYPLVGYNSPGMMCAYWPKTAPQTRVDLKNAPEVLMVQSEMDPATPYGPALKAHEAVPGTRLLSVDNQGNHGVYVERNNPCVDKVVDDFLDKGELIGQDSVCPAVALPKESQVFAVGKDLPGKQLPMPEHTDDGLLDILRKLLQALLDEILAPKN